MEFLLFKNPREGLMKLLLRREQKSGFTGKVTFMLDVRSELTEDEKSNIKKYKLGDTMLYQRMTMADKGSGLLGVASRLAFKMMNLTVSINDLSLGKKIDCKEDRKSTRLNSSHIQKSRMPSSA